MPNHNKYYYASTFMMFSNMMAIVSIEFTIPLFLLSYIVLIEKIHSKHLGQCFAINVSKHVQGVK